MGLCLSLLVGPSMPRVQYDFLSLTRLDIASLSNTYCAMKRNKNGFVEISNVLKHFNVEGNVFMQNSFMLLNRDEANFLPLLNFEEFVYLVWNFSSCDNLAFLAFSIYDTDRENDLNADEADQISKDICGSDDFSSLKDFVPMKFTGINNSFYSQYTKSNPKLLDKLSSFQRVMQQKTLGKSRWKTIASKRTHMAKSSSFIDLFDVLKLLALKTGIKRDFIAISRHLIIKDEKRKNTQKVSPIGPVASRSNSQSTAAGSDILLAGYSEPMQRWLKDKMSTTTVHTYHPVYRSYSADYENYVDPSDIEESVKNYEDGQSVGHTDPSVKSEHSRLERKLIRQNSLNSKKSNGNISNVSDAPSRSPLPMRKKFQREKSGNLSRNVSAAMEDVDSDDENDSDGDVKDFVDHKFGMIGTPYRRQSKHELKVPKRHSL